MGRPIGIDLFAGAGGLSLGFERAGFDVAAAVDVDPIHCAVHSFNFPNCQSICADVREVTGEMLRTKVKRLRKGDLDIDIDVVFGGAPCQGFSLIGKRAMDDPRNELVGQFVRLVVELRPKFFVFENVKGLTIGEHKKFLEEFIEQFKDHKYKVREDYKVLNAADYGVPQDRRRLFLFGARRGQKLPEYPKQTHRARNGEKKKGSKLPLGPSVWHAIGDLPNADDYADLLERDWVEAKGDFGKSSVYVRKLNCKLHFGYDREYDKALLTSSLRTEHSTVSKRRFDKTNHGATEPISRFLKLDPNGICNTLRAGTGSEQGAFTSPRPIHSHEPRCITVREAARLHSYPDWFRLHCTKWHGMRQIGNSVPPLLGEAVARQVIEALGVKPQKPKKVLKLTNQSFLKLNLSQAAEHFKVDPGIMGKRARKK